MLLTIGLGLLALFLVIRVLGALFWRQSGRLCRQPADDGPRRGRAGPATAPAMAAAAVAVAAGSCRACSAGSAAPWPATGSTTSSPAVTTTPSSASPTTTRPRRPSRRGAGRRLRRAGRWRRRLGRWRRRRRRRRLGRRGRRCRRWRWRLGRWRRRRLVAVAAVAAVMAVAAGKSSCRPLTLRRTTAADLTGRPRSLLRFSTRPNPGPIFRSRPDCDALPRSDRGKRSDGREPVRGTGGSLMDLNARRLEKLRRLFEADRVDAFLVASEPNVRYLTGFTGEASVAAGRARTGRCWSPTAGSRPSSSRNAPAWRSTSGRSGSRCSTGSGEVVDKLGVAPGRRSSRRA